LLSAIFVDAFETSDLVFKSRDLRIVDEFFIAFWLVVVAVETDVLEEFWILLLFTMVVLFIFRDEQDDEADEDNEIVDDELFFFFLLETLPLVVEKALLVVILTAGVLLLLLLLLLWDVLFDEIFAKRTDAAVFRGGCLFNILLSTCLFSSLTPTVVLRRFEAAEEDIVDFTPDDEFPPPRAGNSSVSNLKSIGLAIGKADPLSLFLFL